MILDASSVVLAQSDEQPDKTAKLLFHSSQQCCVENKNFNLCWHTI